ncbi:MAG: tetratricopeptide repeat protein [Clostridium sp.]
MSRKNSETSPTTTGMLRDVIRDESLTMEERSDAVSEMDKLAENGDMYAQYLMGKLWRDGPLLIPDSVEARYWFEQAAEQGHLVAQYSLAQVIPLGRFGSAGYPDGDELAIHRRGQRRPATPCYRLAKECLKGEVIEKDTADAVEWFAKSAEGEITTPSICWASCT